MRFTIIFQGEIYPQIIYKRVPNDIAGKTHLLLPNAAINKKTPPLIKKLPNVLSLECLDYCRLSFVFSLKTQSLWDHCRSLSFSWSLTAIWSDSSVFFPFWLWKYEQCYLDELVLLSEWTSFDCFSILILICAAITQLDFNIIAPIQGLLINVLLLCWWIRITDSHLHSSITVGKTSQVHFVHVTFSWGRFDHCIRNSSIGSLITTVNSA